MQRLRPSIIHAIDIFTLGDAGTSGSRTLREGYPVGASTHATGDISLKFFLRIAWELGALDTKKYALLSERAEELGRMVGGWRKGLEAKTPAQ